jgi:hypothetical protein
MTKKELEEKVRILERTINVQQLLINQLQVLLDNGVMAPSIDPDACPMGGKHEYNTHTTGGWMCKCGKTMPFSPKAGTIIM